MNKPAAANENHVSLQKRYEIFGEYVRTVLSLATGSLVLSVTFLHDVLGTGSEHKPRPPILYPRLLGASWAAFLVSVIGCLFYLYYLALASNEKEDCSRQMIIGNLVGLAGFGIGLLCLGLFGWLNLR